MLFRSKWKDGPFRMEGSLDFPKQDLPKLQKLSEPEKELENAKDSNDHASDHASEHGKDYHKRYHPKRNRLYVHPKSRDKVFHSAYKPPKQKEEE